MKDIRFDISPELLAAYMDGNATAQESRLVFEALENDGQLREMMRISRAIDEELDMCISDTTFRPMTAMAASCGDENYCCLECEKFILNRRGIQYREDELLAIALKNKWQGEKGTALFNIGRHLENNGLEVKRQYRSEIEDIIKALEKGSDVIAVVDGGELIGDRRAEEMEDRFIGPIPDHSVVVLGCDNERVRIYDPDSRNSEDAYLVEEFMDAWKDSKCYMVVAEGNSGSRPENN